MRNKDGYATKEGCSEAHMSSQVQTCMEACQDSSGWKTSLFCKDEEAGAGLSFAPEGWALLGAPSGTGRRDVQQEMGIRECVGGGHWLVMRPHSPLSHPDPYSGCLIAPGCPRRS